MHVACMRYSFKMLVGKSSGMNPHRRRRRWEYNIKMDVTKIEREKCGPDSTGSG